MADQVLSFNFECSWTKLVCIATSYQVDDSLTHMVTKPVSIHFMAS
jgi:hypothetical protein